MKFLVIATLLFTTNICKSQSLTSTTYLDFATFDCRDTSSHNEEIDSIDLYDVKTGARAYTYKRDYKNWSNGLNDVLVGTYKIKYLNNFQIPIEKIVELELTDTNFIKLCPDELLSYPKNTIAKLRNGESIEVRFYSKGCFHSIASKLVFRKWNNSLVATAYLGHGETIWKRNSRVVRYNFHKHPSKEVIVADAEVAAFVRFENEIEAVNNGGCTTIDYYNLRSKYLNADRIDGNCSWNGFSFLYYSLFKTDIIDDYIELSR